MGYWRDCQWFREPVQAALDALPAPVEVDQPIDLPVAEPPVAAEGGGADLAEPAVAAELGEEPDIHIAEPPVAALVTDRQILDG